MAFLEIACFNLESAIIASSAGADRIELCVDKRSGGTTPSLISVVQTKEHVGIPVYVMLRPRGGGFKYSDAEFEQMKVDVESFRTVADGLVFGILDERREVDVVRTAELVGRAQPLPCTFHRAFDETSDLYSALEDVIGTGCKSILTSAACPSAWLGSKELTRLVEQSRGRITVIPGGGVRSTHVRELWKGTGATHFHSSAVMGGGENADAQEICRMKMALKA